MIAAGIDIHARNEDGRVALHSAAEGGSLELVDFLTQSGASPRTVDYAGATPLHLAAASGQTGVVDRLVGLGSDIDARNLLGETAFNLAVQNGYEGPADFLADLGADQAPPQFPFLSGAYLGQDVPGTTPEVFAPGVVSSYATIHGIVTFSPTGQEVFWSVIDPAKRGSSLLQMKLEEGRWSSPGPPSFASEASDDVPFFSPDGKTLFFLSDRPVEEGGGRTKENIWFVGRGQDSWTAPGLVQSPANEMDLHWQFSVSNDGALYFASSDGGGLGLNDIYRSELIDGVYQEPENLGAAINSEYADFAPFVAPDESYLIFTSVGRPDGLGGSDLFISFRSGDGSWTKAENLGDAVNTTGGELLTSLSPDGRYLFFSGMRDGRKGVFWMDARFIEELRPGQGSSP
jgi:hypothetical protein